MAIKPNFIVVGAAKAGTTSVYNYLREHPQVFMSPVKEPKFFALCGESLQYGGPGDSDEMQRHSLTTLEDYHALFRSANGATAIGEASTLYLYSDEAAGRMHQYRSDLKIVAFLRNPIDRAYSNYTYMVRRGREPLRDFRAALDAEPERIASNWMPGWHYTRRGLYYEQLRRYYDHFAADQIQVFLYDDLKQDAAEVMKQLYGFVGVDNTYSPNMRLRHNVSGTPRNEWIHRFLMNQGPVKRTLKRIVPRSIHKRLHSAARDRNLAPPEKMAGAERDRLTALYRSDISRLQKLIGRDLAHWLN